MLSGKMLPFPSPLGEMGLSIYIMAKVTELNALEFPSPLGEMGLSIFIARGMILAYEDG